MTSTLSKMEVLWLLLLNNNQQEVLDLSVKTLGYVARTYELPKLQGKIVGQLLFDPHQPFKKHSIIKLDAVYLLLYFVYNTVSILVQCTFISSF